MDTLVTIAVVSILVPLIWWVLDDYQRVPLHELGIETVQRVLRFEAPDYRSEVWRRGWITRKEWRALLVKQEKEIAAELKVRETGGLNDGRERDD